MAGHPRKFHPPKLEAVQRSWVGKFVRDGLENQLGYVHEVRETEAGLRLIARFPNEDVDREIALEPDRGVDYLYPEDDTARYKTPTAEDLKRIKALSRKS